MIYTVTFNPAIDYVMHLDRLSSGCTNRSESEYTVIGGKGINVSVILKRLGVPNIAMGFIAGFTGDAIKRSLENDGIKTDFVVIENGISRINVKIKADSETELNGRGPDITEQALQEFFGKLDRLTDGDTLVLAGSVPTSLPSDIYSKIMEYVSGKDIKFVVDAEKDLLLNSLKFKPFLIKPNHHELGAIFGKELKTNDEIMHHAKKLQDMGALNVLVSMAENGAILIDEKGDSHYLPAFCGKVKNSVGAGDSMVAGFLAGIQNSDFEYALKLGSAAGSATAFSEGLADKDDIYNILKGEDVL